MQPNQPKPSKSAYLWITPFVILGILSLYFIIISIFDVINGMDDGNQIVIPGSEEFEFKEDGTYTVFYEYQSVVDGKHYSHSPTSLPTLDFEIKNEETGEEVEISNSSSSSSYSFGSREGKSVFKFEIEDPGDYDFSVSLEDDDQEYVLNIVHEFGKKLFFMILKMFAAIFGMMIAFGGLVGVFLIIYFKRRNSVVK